MSHASSIIITILSLGLAVLLFRVFSFIGFHLLKMAAGALLLAFIAVLVMPVNMMRDWIALIHQVSPDVAHLVQVLLSYL